MTTLTFLRHATAQDRTLPIPDADRQLVGKGKRQVQRVAHFCAEHEMLPAHLLCSPLLRAQQTAQWLHQHLPGCPTPQTVAWLAIDTAVETMIDELEKLATDGQDNLWLVGHEPDFSTVISHLLGSQASLLKVKKSSLIRLEVDFAAGVGALLWSIPNTLMP